MEIILGPIVGALSHQSAKIWIYWSQNSDEKDLPECEVFADEKCTQPVMKAHFQPLSSAVYEEDNLRGMAGLVTAQWSGEYQQLYYKIYAPSFRQEQREQIYSFRPFPEAGQKIDSFSFALISCHRPTFCKGIDKYRVENMWQKLGDKMFAHDSRFLIQAGDQVYADKGPYNAWKACLKCDSPAQRLWYFRRVYLKSWSFPVVRRVLRHFPQYMIWDDHDIVNGWGSNREHRTSEKCLQAYDAARQAYVEFQHSHNPDSLREGKFYYAFHYGPVAFLVLDIRGERDITCKDKNKGKPAYPLAGEQQWEDIRAWLNSDAVQASKVLFVVSSVPVIHLNRNWVSLGFLKNDIRDQWSTNQNQRERRILLTELFNWSGPNQRPVFILSGDVHVGTVGQMVDETSGQVVYQISSSPIANLPAFLLDFFIAYASSKFQFHLDEAHQRPVRGIINKRYRRKNFAIIEVKFENDQPVVTLNMYRAGSAQPSVVEFKDF